MSIENKIEKGLKIVTVAGMVSAAGCAPGQLLGGPASTSTPELTRTPIVAKAETQIAPGVTPTLLEAVRTATATAAAMPRLIGTPTHDSTVVSGQVVTDTMKAQSVITETKGLKQEVQSVFTGLRGLLLSIDETKPAWPERGQGEPAITVHNGEDLDGNKIKGRSITQLNTGATDFEMASGGRWAFYGSVKEGVGLKASGVKHSEGDEVFLDKTSGEVLYVLKKGAKGTKVVIPGGTDTYLRGNLVFVVGKEDDNTATEFETDTASVYREKRNSGSLNRQALNADNLELVAAMGKVYANSLFNGMNCKGKGCRDAVGVYVIRGGDKKTGAGAEIIFAAVYSGKELEGLKLKK